jgi:hypothetical protein
MNERFVCKSGELVLLSEIKDNYIDLKDGCIRVVGYLTFIDFSRDICQIELKNDVLLINIALVVSSLQTWKVGELCGFIGMLSGLTTKFQSLFQNFGSTPRDLNNVDEYHTIHDKEEKVALHLHSAKQRRISWDLNQNHSPNTSVSDNVLQYILHAEVVLNCKNMDVNLYERVVLKRREFLEFSVPKSPNFHTK